MCFVCMILWTTLHRRDRIPNLILSLTVQVQNPCSLQSTKICLLGCNNRILQLRHHLWQITQSVNLNPRCGIRLCVRRTLTLMERRMALSWETLTACGQRGRRPLPLQGSLILVICFCWDYVRTILSTLSFFFNPPVRTPIRLLEDVNGLSVR